MHSCRVRPCCSRGLIAACTRLFQVTCIQPAPLQVVRMLWLSPAAAGHLKVACQCQAITQCCPSVAHLIQKEIVPAHLVALQTLFMLPAACAHVEAEPCRDSPPGRLSPAAP